jgi:Bacterial Ig domain
MVYKNIILFFALLYAFTAQAATYSFQQGVNGYSGANDVEISNQYPGNGITRREVRDGCYTVAGTAGYSTRTLLQFTGLQVPATERVVSANLVLSLTSWVTGFEISGYYLKTSWDPASSSLGWMYRATGLLWAVPGAQGPDTDVFSGKQFNIVNIKATGSQAVTVALDPAIVDAWVHNGTGSGIELLNSYAGKTVWIDSSRSTDISHRPLLTFVTDAAAPASPTTSSVVTFRNGENGYSGTQDVGINNEYGGNGITGRSDVEGCYNITGPKAYSAKPLLKFTDISVPAGQAVASASLTLTFRTWTTGFNVMAYPVINTWNAAASSLGWLNRDIGVLWGAPGASATGEDIGGAVGRFSGFTGTGDQAITIDLDPKLVNGWIQIPASNQGILLSNDSAGKVANILSSRAATISSRPLLKLTLMAAAADTTPPQVSIASPAPNAQVTGTITAAATASDNVAVAGVQFLLDGAAYGAEITAPPYTLSLIATNLTSGAHTLTAQAWDSAGNSAVSSPVSFTVIYTPLPVSRFFAPPQENGSIFVRLYPTEDVRTGIPTLVTFGVPFTRGSMTEPGLQQLRVLLNGQEIPANVSALTPWRHTTNTAVDNQYVRVARIQITYTPTAAYPNYDQVVVDWGNASRTRSVATFLDPRSAWHLVTTGSFTAADNVYEPDVYAVLPAAFLSLGALTLTQAAPFEAAVSPLQDDPHTMLNAQGWPGYLELQNAEKNFFYSLIDNDPRVTAANQCPYKMGYEPWLYDRSSAIYNLYFQSGFFVALREAVRSSQFYMNNLYTDQSTPMVAGIFKLKNPNPAGYIGANGAMYSYNENLAYTYWLVGDDKPLPYISWVAAAQKNINDEPTHWTPGAPAWTERHNAFRLLDYLVAYEVTGAGKEDLLSVVSDLIWLQNGAGGQIPANRVDGGLYHYGQQAEDGTPGILMASPWLSALVVNAMAREYGISEDPAVASFLVRMGTFISAALRTDEQEEYGVGPLLYADYLMRYDGTTDQRDGSQVEHALDVQTALAWGYFFSILSNQPNSVFKQSASSLYTTYHYGVQYWTRPDAPAAGNFAYRVNPWRKYGWQYHPAVSLTWIMQY